MNSDDLNLPADDRPGEDVPAVPDDIPADGLTEEPGEPDAAPGPSWAAPPRIVGESPVGLPLRSALRPAVEPAAPEIIAEPAPEPEPEPAALAAVESAAEEAPAPDVEPTGPPVEPPTGDTLTIPLPIMPAPEPEPEPAALAAAESAAEEAPAPDVERAGPESEPVPDLTVPAFALEMESEAPPVQPPTGETTTLSVPVIAAPAQPTTPEPPAEGRVEWDDDISPELASILFGASQAAAERPAPAALRDRAAAPSAPAVSPAAVTPTAPPSATAIPTPKPVEPITLTDIAEARRLPLVAEGVAAPAPDVTVSGKVRYERLEEPLKGDRGQRTREGWDYFGPDYPMLEGRAVRRVRSEEIAYADGSWYWRYEREYAGGERDRREVRANTDRAYIERRDEIARKDPATGQRSRRREFAALILAGPLHEEKRGFFSRVLGRRAAETPDGPRAWRPASQSESRRARKQGGEAF